jgi:hypothetical protein
MKYSVYFPGEFERVCYAKRRNILKSFTFDGSNNIFKRFQASLRAGNLSGPNCCRQDLSLSFVKLWTSGMHSPVRRREPSPLDYRRRISRFLKLSGGLS